MSHTHDLFQDRHIGPSAEDQATMLATLGFDSLDDFIDAVVPGDIRLKDALKIPAAKTEQEALEALRLLAAQNQVFRSYLGMGYHDCVTPTVIQRNVLENPGWYTAYTPYQAEIAQGRLEALRLLAAQNQVFRSYLGMGYHDCVTPTVIQRNVLEIAH